MLSHLYKLFMLFFKRRFILFASSVFRGGEGTFPYPLCKDVKVQAQRYDYSSRNHTKMEKRQGKRTKIILLHPANVGSPPPGKRSARTGSTPPQPVYPVFLPAIGSRAESYRKVAEIFIGAHENFHSDVSSI
jgi:hypothetical protein